MKFDVDKYMRNIMTIGNLKSKNHHLHLTKEDCFELCETMIAQFKNGPSLERCEPPVRVVGDIHGQLPDLIRLLNSRVNEKPEDAAANRKKAPAFATTRWVFLGDYVDRGQFSLGTITLMFCLKLRYPGLFVLLRGNHETRSINYTYGFKDEVTTKIESVNGERVFQKFNEVFSWMPLACLISNKILCMHGGISPHLKSIESIEKIKRPFHEAPSNSLEQDLLWADPMDFSSNLAAIDDEARYEPNRTRGLSVCFNEAAVAEVCSNLKLSLIVRAHQMIPEGFQFFADRKLLTVFSAPRYQGESDNQGATLSINVNGSMGISRMKYGGKFLGEQQPDEITLKSAPASSSSSKSASFKQ